MLLEQEASNTAALGRQRPRPTNASAGGLLRVSSDMNASCRQERRGYNESRNAGGGKK